MVRSKKLLSLDLLCLAGSVVASFALWAAYLRFNLPVAGNVDERTDLGVLSRFHTTGMDPHFFFYPTLYFYLTYFLTRPWSFSNVLLHGRMVNLACVGLLGWIAYMFCIRFFRSRTGGLVAAIAVVTSPIIAFSGSYLDTDVFLAMATLGAIYYLTAYFEDGRRSSWLAAMVMLGLAVSCKYTAFLLFIAYVIQEAALRLREKEAEGGPFVSRRLLVGLLGAAGLVLLLAAIVFPTHAAIEFVARNRSNANGRPAAEYMPFFHSLRTKLGAAGVFFLALSALVLRARLVYRAIAPSRLYQGLAIIVGLFLITTPYSWITPKKFVLDLGSQSKLNLVAVSGTSQWHNYWTWYTQSEALIFGVLAVIGFVLLAKHWRQWGLALGYIVLYFLAIGSAHRGHPRYLTPILPILYCFAGYALVWLAALPVQGRRLSSALQYAAMACVVVATFYSTGLHVRAVHRLQTAHDEFWASYSTAVKLNASRVYFIGDAPNVELTNAGYLVEELPQAASRNPEVLSALKCRQLLILEDDFADPAILKKTTLRQVLDVHGIYGQKAFVKQGCEQ